MTKRPFDLLAMIWGLSMVIMLALFFLGADARIVAVMGGVSSLGLWVRRRRHDELVAEYRQTLRGSVVKMIRLMENNPRTMPGNMKRDRFDQFGKVVSLNEGRNPIPIRAVLLAKPDDRPEEHTRVAREVVDWNEEMASKFWKQAQGIRNGALILLLLLRDRNIDSARLLLKEHLGQDRGQDYEELQDLLRVIKKGSRIEIGKFPYRNLLAMEETLQEAKKVLDGLDFRPFDEDEGKKVYQNEDILVGMRMFTR